MEDFVKQECKECSVKKELERLKELLAFYELLVFEEEDEKAEELKVRIASA